MFAFISTSALTLLLVVANVTGAAMAYPQARRLVRTRRTDGLSAVWAGVSISMNAWWVAYGVTNQLWGLVPVSAVGIVLYLVIATVFTQVVGARAVPPLLLGLLVLGMVPLPVLLVAGWPAAGVAIGLCYGMQLAPAMVSACRSRDLSGVAAGTWIMAWVESAVWIVYGGVVLDAALLVGGVSGTFVASVILYRLWSAGHRPARPIRRLRPA